MTSAPSHATAPDSPIVGLAASLAQWRPISLEQSDLRDEYLRFIGSMDAPLARSGGPEHITASCFVFTPDLANVLLCFHRKGQFWVQLGGHVEALDPSVASAALREAHEEGGIVDLAPLGSHPVDVNRHALSSSYGTCRVHWDIGYAAIAQPGAIPVTSEESEDVAWWPVDALPDNVPPMFAERLATVLAQTAIVQTTTSQTRTAETTTIRTTTILRRIIQTDAAGATSAKA